MKLLLLLVLLLAPAFAQNDRVEWLSGKPGRAEARIVTDQPIGLTCDRARIKNGLLEASGNIVVLPADDKLPKAQLKGDELVMFLRIGDATLRGNVRSPASAPEPVKSAFPNTMRMMFPPEIIK